MFIDVILSLETPFFLVCVQTEHKVNLRSRAFCIQSRWKRRKFARTLKMFKLEQKKECLYHIHVISFKLEWKNHSRQPPTCNSESEILCISVGKMAGNAPPL